MNVSPSDTPGSSLADERLQSFYELGMRLAAVNPITDAAQMHVLLEFVLERALELTGACQGMLLLDDLPRRSLYHLALMQEPGQELPLQSVVREPAAASITVNITVIQEVLQQGRPVLVDDMSTAKQYQQHHQPANATPPAGYVGRSVLVLPLTADQRVVGMIYLDHRQPARFSADDLEFLTTFSSLALLAILREQDQRLQRVLHARQVQEQTRHLTYLNEIGSAMTRSLDLTHVFQVIIEGVNTLLGTERTSVFLIDEQTNDLVLRYSNEDGMHIRLPSPWQGIAGWVATHDMPTLVNDASSDPRHLRQFALETGYEAHSILCVPLKVEGRVIGVVQVLNKIGGQPFTLHHQNLLIDLTRWAAIALHNARLFEERGRAYERLAAEQERRIAAETRTAMAAVVLDMAHTMNNIIGAIRAWALTLEHEPVSGVPGGVYRQLLANIRHNAEEAIDLIRTMRGPLEQATIVPTDIHQCMDRVIQGCWWPDNVQLSITYGRHLPLARANPTRLEAVFQNLIANAIQAMLHEGGNIFLSTRCTEHGWVEITIRDNGPGIAPEIQQQLFTPGVTNQEGRLGIGLWLVETFIHQFGGTITWNTRVDEGTTFVIVLPPIAAESEGGDNIHATDH